MKLNSGLPFSLIRYGLPYNYPKLESEVRTDVVIVGGGISGALSAASFVEAGLDCIVVDKRTIGLGSTAACTSLLQYEIDVSLNDLISVRGRDHAVRAYTLCNDALIKMKQLCSRLGFDGLVETESLYYGVSKNDEERLKRECETRQQIGLDVQYLDARALESSFEIKTFGGILSKNAAFADAYMLTHALLQFVSSKGARVFDRTEVKSVIQKKQHHELTTDNNVKIKANHIVYATGYEAIETIARNKNIQLRSTYATISESFADCEELPLKKTLIWNTADPYLYLRCTDEGRIIIGGRDDLFLNPTRRDKAIGIKTKALVRDFNKLFPAIKFLPEFSWAGTFIKTKDGLPFIGNYPGRKSYYALGFGGNGIIFSLIAAEINRDLILGRKNDNAALFRFDRE